ncbi:hypothetical protein E3N88_31240 [Mikania micrantha]|uniref:Reverse transcriptase zinc-binding domain-containing protein n=1 Tax=Mikania micrantha TaxID=192012 RepID=A0A5N6MPR7_9ASTR|nr:hypothetical protein E3N88_31240 [Mikania micrantha]
MEALSCMIKKAGEQGIFTGINISGSGLCISHLLFADDALIMGDWTDQNISNLRRLLRVFNMVFVLKVNLGKCNMVGINVGNSEVSKAASKLHCHVGELPFTYLGLSVGDNMNREVHWQPVVDVFRKRLSSWKARNLSFGGRITLIKSVLNSLPSYYFSLYKASIKGSLGIGCLRDINLSLLAKWWWRFKKEPFSLWARVVGGIHTCYPLGGIVPLKPNITGVWKNIASLDIDMNKRGVNLRYLFKGWVENVLKLAFWTDLWCGVIPLCFKFPSLFKLESHKGCKIKDRLVNTNGVISLDWKWTRPPRNQHEKDELELCTNLMGLIRMEDMEDRWLWLGSKDGIFSVSSLKSRLYEAKAEVLVYNFHWSKLVPIKVNAFAWRAAMKRIPTKDALERRQVPVSNTSCPLCGDEEESADHLLIGFRVSSEVWSIISLWCKIPPIFAFHVRDLFSIYKTIPGGAFKKEVIHAIILVGCWCLWQTRNQSVFQNKRPSLCGLVEEIRRVSYMWTNNRAKNMHWSWEGWRNFRMAAGL